MNCIKPAFSDFNSIEFSKSWKAKFSTYCVPKGLHRKRQQRTEPCSHCCSSIVSCIIACLLVWPPLSYKLKSYCLENFQLRAKWKGIRRSTPFGGIEEKRSHFWKVILLRAFSCWKSTRTFIQVLIIYICGGFFLFILYYKSGSHWSNFWHKMSIRVVNRNEDVVWIRKPFLDNGILPSQVFWINPVEEMGVVAPDEGLITFAIRMLQWLLLALLNLRKEGLVHAL